MKKLTNCISTVKDGKLTFTADIVEADANEFRFPVQQTTVGYINPLNMKWPRHIQVSSEATFVKAFGNGMAISHDDLVEMAAKVEPKTSFPPLFKTQPKSESLTVEISSELNPDFQWQLSATIDNTASWTNISGATSSTLCKTNLPQGVWVRCVAKSDAGSMTSNPVQIQ
jgi:hypothetical protein